MKEETKVITNKIPLILTLLFISTIFMGIGYSAINEVTLNVQGTAKATVLKEVYITDAYVSGASNGAVQSDSGVIAALQTTMNSHTVLSNTNSASTITYTLTIKNNTEDKYVYDQAVYDNEFYDNSNITFTVSGITQGEALEAGASKTFTVTFKYKNTTTTNNILNSYINFRFNKTQMYTITYVGVTGSYPSSVEENSPLSVNFNNANLLVKSVTMGGTTLTTSQYSFTNSTITINSVTGDVVITLVDTSAMKLRVTSTTTSFSNVAISSLPNTTYDGINLSGKTIKSIKIDFTYNSINGNIRDKLTGNVQVNGVTVGSASFTFAKKSTSASITINNLNIANGDTFDVVFTNYTSGVVSTLSTVKFTYTLQ